MKIDRLTMHNFGVYAGTNTLSLMNEKPVILIGGLNGRGKTTILEAILLALYGRRSFTYEESKLAFPKYLSRLVNTADRSRQSWVEMTFELAGENEVTTYQVRREWSSFSATPSLKTVVFKNRQLDEMLSENWDVFIEEMLPSAIAPFFFFDGEKISELASGDTNDTSMKNSIRALLGITVVDQAILDVEKIAKAKRKSIKSGDESKEIEQLEKKVTEAEAAVRAKKIEESDFNLKCTQLTKRLKEAEDEFAATGGNLAINRKELQARRLVQEELLEEATSRVLDIAAGDLPMLLVLPLLESILNAAESENEQKSIRMALERLPALLKSYSASKKKQFNVDSFISFIKETTNETPLVYDLSDSGTFQLRTLCETLNSRQRSEAAQRLSERKSILDEIDNLDNYLSLNVDESAAGKTYEHILTLTKELATAEEQKRVIIENMDLLESQLEEAKRLRDRFVERTVSGMELADDTRRIIIYANYTAKVLAEYKKRLQERKTQYLAETMTNCFAQLVSKKGLISEIKINPQTLDFSYFNSQGTEVSRSSFSAGEKQLLMIAMLWGLAICSRKQLPVIIDTPLARLDNSHRAALINNYFPKASEQTILLSTDAEIEGRYFSMLQKYVDKAYTLVFDEGKSRTRIEEGYFGGEKK